MALAVVTLGIIAAFNLIVQISTGSLQMKERTIAGWIASNEITRLRLSGEFPEVSQFDGDVGHPSIVENQLGERIIPPGVRCQVSDGGHRIREDLERDHRASDCGKHQRPKNRKSARLLLG